MGYINTIEQYLLLIDDENKRKILKDLLIWIESTFDLVLEIRYNQPMFVKNGTFILSISNSKNHMSVAPELETMNYFRDEILMAGYESTQMLFRIKYKDEINYNLLTRIINYNIETKKNHEKFWR